MPLHHGEAVASFCFDQDGRRVISLTQDGLVWLWDTSPSGAGAGVASKCRPDQRLFQPQRPARRHRRPGLDGAGLGRDDGSRGSASSPPRRHGRECGLQPRWSADRHHEPRSHRPHLGGCDRQAGARVVAPRRCHDRGTIQPGRHADPHLQQRSHRPCLGGRDGQGSRAVSAAWQQRQPGHVQSGRESTSSPLVPTAASTAGGRPTAEASASRWNTGRRCSAPSSPPMESVLTACADGTARIWDIASGHELHRLKHGAQVNRAVFSPDGVHVVTASNDGTADASGTRPRDSRLRSGMAWPEVPGTGHRDGFRGL